MYAEDDMLMLSGIQHFAFCRRQWALIHIEQLWNENLLTIEGQLLHQHVDDPSYRQKQGDVVCLRSVNIASKQLGLYGLSDVVELHPTNSANNAITHPDYPGFWEPYPIEYKHGHPKADNVDAVQLTAQTMCLEEQYGIQINEGALFYGEIRRREVVVFSDTLREQVKTLSAEMHKVFNAGIIPRAEIKSYCNSCSLKEKCMPKCTSKGAASLYLNQNLYA